MKRVLFGLLASLALLSTPAQAGSFSFGLSLQSYSQVSFIPILVGQIGYNFGSASDGFSLEATIAPWFIINTVGVQGFYRIPVLTDGANLYIGAGAAYTFSLLALPDANFQFGFAHVYALVGWEGPINSDYTYFLEIAPGVNPAAGSFLLRIALGLRAHRTEFPVRI